MLVGLLTYVYSFPEYVKYEVSLLELSRCKIGAGKRRSNNFTEFPRSCAPSDGSVVHYSDSSIIIQSFMNNMSYGTTLRACRANSNIIKLKT